MLTPKRIIIGILVFILVFGFLFWKFGPSFSQEETGPITLTYWGLWEEDNLISPVIAEYQRLNPNITIKYVRQSSINYRTRSQAKIRDGSGPDVLRVHNTWLPMFETDLSPAPQSIFNLAEYQQTFYPIATENFVRGDKIYAVPIEIDGLAMFYNENTLRGVGAQVPTTWQELMDTAVKLTVTDPSGQIKTAGAALGTTSNVDHWSDIVGLLMFQQPGTGIESNQLDFAKTGEVLSFYTDFVTNPRRKVWDASFPASTDAFAQERVAFYFAPSWKAHELRLKNRNLNFKIAPVPQLPGRQVAWASYWGEGVSATSKHQEEAWKFAKYLASADAQRLMYKTASVTRLFGEPYSRVDMGPELANDPLVGAFVKQGPYYKSWFLASQTWDNGLNDEMIKYWEDAINAILQTRDSTGAVGTLDSGVKSIINKYSQRVEIPAQQ